MEAKLKPFAWCEHAGVIIHDPDGWRGPNAPDWYTPISWNEFVSRIRISTIEVIDSERYNKVR